MTTALAATLVASLMVAPAAQPAPQPAPAAQPTVSMDPEAVRMREIMSDPVLHAEYQRAQTTAHTGLALMGVGFVAGVGIGLPAMAMYRNSLEKAENATYRVDQARPIRQAETRRRVMLGSFITGGAVASIGLALAIVGYSRRNRLTRGGFSTVAVAPAIGGGHFGAAATLRF